MNTSSRACAAILGGDGRSHVCTDAASQRAQANLSAVPYLPGLDGMRAIAVVAVMIYHANHNWLPGGFLGVEVFFVISGYLITLLLIGERERTGAHQAAARSGGAGRGACCRRCS